MKLPPPRSRAMVIYLPLGGNSSESTPSNGIPKSRTSGNTLAHLFLRDHPSCLYARVLCSRSVSCRKDRDCWIRERRRRTHTIMSSFRRLTEKNIHEIVYFLFFRLFFIISHLKFHTFADLGLGDCRFEAKELASTLLLHHHRHATEKQMSFFSSGPMLN